MLDLAVLLEVEVGDLLGLLDLSLLRLQLVLQLLDQIVQPLEVLLVLVDLQGGMGLVNECTEYSRMSAAPAVAVLR